MGFYLVGKWFYLCGSLIAVSVPGCAMKIVFPLFAVPTVLTNFSYRLSRIFREGNMVGDKLSKLDVS